MGSRIDLLVVTDDDGVDATDVIDETDEADGGAPDAEVDDIAFGALGSYVVEFGHFLEFGTYSIAGLDNAVIGLAIVFDICRPWNDVHGCLPLF